MSKQSTSDIRIKVQLDVNKIPESILWDSSDNQVENKKANAIMLSVWDPSEESTLRMDLWTKEMTVDDMKKFIHQSILLMADTLKRATGEEAMSETMRDFGDYFAEKLNLLTPKKD
jgi:gliding motility-associated protein GldC